jgi:hypothetical protein
LWAEIKLEFSWNIVEIKLNEVEIKLGWWNEVGMKIELCRNKLSWNDGVMLEIVGLE